MQYPIGKRIKSLRQQHKLTQEKLADTTELSLRHIQNIESGDRIPSLPTIEKIANVFELSLSQFFAD